MCSAAIDHQIILFTSRARLVMLGHARLINGNDLPASFASPFGNPGVVSGRYNTSIFSLSACLTDVVILTSWQYMLPVAALIANPLAHLHRCRYCELARARCRAVVAAHSPIVMRLLLPGR
jgi:hypothetical protein